MLSVVHDSELRLSDEQRNELVKGSAISLEVLRRARVYGESDARAAAKLLGRAPKYWEGHLPVIVYPYYLPFHRDPVRYRGKPAKPFETPREDGSVSLAKYVEAKGSAVHLYFGPSLLEGRALKNVETPLWITEGEKKCLSAESHGLACVAVSGVNQWHEKGARGLHSDFAHLALADRDIFLAFDRDALANKQVRDQEVALGRALLAAGARVYVVRWPEDAPKLDDFLARHELTELGALIDDAKEHGRIEQEARTVGVPAPATGLTDLANAERFQRMHGEDLRYCDQLQAWFVWSGKRWERDGTQAILRRAMLVARKIYEEADALGDEDSRNALRAHARASEAHARLGAMVKLAGALKSFAVRLEAFDADPWLLNCENGTLDLRTGKLGPHERRHLLTKLAPVHYRDDARHERWDGFLEQVSDGRPELVAFLQTSVGYSLTGDTREDKLFFLYGPAGRGKSTFVSAIEAALGDYARTADVSTFLASPNSGGGDRPRPDLVRLKGSRIVICKEIEAGARLAEGLVKTVTGGDVITVRDLHSQPIEMRPSYKLWLIANDPPVVRGDDTGMWRRIVRVPFTRPIPHPEKGFREALVGEPELRSAVLAWAAAGVLRWLKDGLVIPDVVAASTAEYRAEMDPTGEFLARRCCVEWEAKTSRQGLRAAYEGWCKEEGHTPLGARRFAAAVKEALRMRGFDPARANTSVWDPEGQRVKDGWKYIRLLTTTELEALRVQQELAEKEAERKAAEAEAAREGQGGPRDIGTQEAPNPLFFKLRAQGAINDQDLSADLCPYVTNSHYKEEKKKEDSKFNDPTPSDNHSDQDNPRDIQTPAAAHSDVQGQEGDAHSKNGLTNGHKPPDGAHRWRL